VLDLKKLFGVALRLAKFLTNQTGTYWARDQFTDP